MIKFKRRSNLKHAKDQNPATSSHCRISSVLLKMEHLAGVVENRPQMRDQKLASSLGREEPPVRFTSLPPLIETSLVGPKPSIPDKKPDEKKEHERIIAESGVPQVKDCFLVMNALYIKVFKNNSDVNRLCLLLSLSTSSYSRFCSCRELIRDLVVVFLYIFRS